MSVFDRIVARARRTPRRIAFPEATEPRTLLAASRLAGEGIVRPLLIGEPGAIRDAARSGGVDLSSIEIESPASGAHREQARAAAGVALQGKRLEPGEPASLLARPLYYAAALVRAGAAAGTVAGAENTTAETLRAALRIIRPAPEARIVSSFFLMALREPTAAGDSVLAFADCGLVEYPDAEELADIAMRTAGHYRLLCEREPKLAFLSFSTMGSADHESVAKLREAARLLRSRSPGFAVDGELQLDAALVPEVARSKAPRSPVAGAANVLIFPNLDAGNIGYKLVERLAGAQAVGPVLQGLSRPANDVSRGCSVEDIVLTAAVTSIQAGQAPRRQL